MFLDFNTSHVSINPFPARCIRLLSVISIHLMFLLIHLQREKRPEKQHFNTSHVSINPWILRNFIENSEISIHLMFLLIYICSGVIARKINFNTSHVSINREVVTGYKNVEHHFNTSHVSINHMDQISREEEKRRFQYISCFY